MSSLLTNNSAMVALQTLKTINKDLSMTQDQISTGKRISNAWDNAALWGISKTMETDVSGFKAISESLSLGSATLSVGRDAAETITGLLDQLKGKIVAAQEENVDRGKIQDDVNALSKQIQVITDAAQFNGLNLLASSDSVEVLASLNRAITGVVTPDTITVKSQDLTTSSGTMGNGDDTTTNDRVALGAGNAVTAGDTNLTTAETLAKDGRELVFTIGGATGTDTGTITETIAFDINDGDITFTVTYDNSDSLTDLTTLIGQAFAGATGNDLSDISVVGNGDATFSVINNRQFEDVKVNMVVTENAGMDTASSLTITAAGAAGATIDLGVADETDNTGTEPILSKRATTITFDADAQVSEGDGYELQTTGIGTSTTYRYVANENDTMLDIVTGLQRAINAENDDAITTRVDTSVTGEIRLYVDKDGTVDASAASIDTIDTSTKGTTGVATGGMFGLDKLDVTTDKGAENALASIEGLIQNAITAAAEFGSIQGRIQTQSEFVSKLMDGFTSGIGTLVDADMEEASARLQALQVQQQLGIQALSIANQAPQNILALFR